MVMDNGIRAPQDALADPIGYEPLGVCNPHASQFPSLPLCNRAWPLPQCQTCHAAKSTTKGRLG